MSRNVEVKARAKDTKKVLETLIDLTKSEGELIKQKDVFYNVPHGRLKLRQIEGVRSELIFYKRPDCEGPKLSQYDKYDSAETSNLSSVLQKALGVKGEVRKTRHLFMLGQSRIHLDDVEGLGSFLEVEVVLSVNQTVEEGQAIAEDIMKILGISEEDLISGAYMDLILRN